MKSRFFILVLVASLFAFYACDEENSYIGSSVLMAGDSIAVETDVFEITTENVPVNYMIASQDSFLLGTFYDENYGTTHADLLAQVKHPERYNGIFQYYPGTVADSALLVLYYTKYAGDKHSPMHISVYEMNKKTFGYFDVLKSNINPADYCDKTTLLGAKTITAVDANDVYDSTSIVIKLDDAFCKKLFNNGVTTEIFKNDSAFQEFFKGLYITTDFGSATMLYLSSIQMEFYHHYTYTAKNSAGNDSLYTVRNIIYFPVNEEVRQANRFLHPDVNTIVNKLNVNAANNQINLISSPANIYTRVKMPLKNMYDKMSKSGKRLSINNAFLRVDIENIESDFVTQPLVSHVLLIKESKLDEFFINKDVPDDEISILGTYAYSVNADTDETEYYYSFDIDNLLAKEFTDAKKNGTVLPDSENYVLMPVRINYDTSNAITAIGPQYLLSSVTICGGKHATRPMKARVVYNNF